ncbi:MAG: hypothetical protein AAF844_21190, partial [Pseudomonadota bacterium]
MSQLRNRTDPWAAVMALCLVFALPAAAASASETAPVDLLFATPHLEHTKPGAVIGYAHTRRTFDAARVGPDFDQ